MASRGSHSVPSVVCGVLGLLLIFGAVLIGYTRRSLFDERAFSVRISESLRDPRVAEFAAEQIVGAIIAASPDLTGVRPVLVGVCQSIVSSAPFRAAVRRSARTLHHSITSGQAKDIVLTVKDVGAVFQSAVATSPGIAAKIPPKLSTVLGRLQSLPGGERAAWLVRFAGRVRAMAFGLLLLGIALCATSVWLAGDKRRAIVQLGMGLTALALLLAITARFGGDILGLFLGKAELAPVAVGVTAAFLSGLLIWAIGLGISGLVLAAASASLLDRVPLVAWSQRSRAWLVGPQPRMRVRLLRGVLGAAAGLSFLLWPIPTITIVGWLAGLVIAFAGLREAFVAALHWLPQATPRDRGRASEHHAVRAWAIGFVTGIALAVIGVTAWLILRSPDDEIIAGEPTAYNGSPALGDRTLDQVIFPTTHNSMGGADVPGWMFPNQSADIKEQLEDGVRAFLIDVHYGTPAGDYVQTEIDSEASMAKYAAAVGQEAMDAAERIRNRLTGKVTGKRDVYMCHGFCELGAMKFVPALRDMKDFLVANPGEVIVIIIQDESVSAEDIQRCFEESGLEELVYRGPKGPPWPTLREMAETDQRVVVMTENLRSGIDWDHWMQDVVQETPYTFHDSTQFSNAPNRGGTSGSLYLMNHWIESTPMPKPSNAAVVNAHDFLLKRIRAFRKQRGHYPNLVAVDFYRVGDLVEVCRELNDQPVVDKPAPAPKPRS